MPRGQHRPLEVRIGSAKIKREGCVERLAKQEVKAAQWSVREGKTRNQIKRWDARIAKLEAQKLAQEAATPNP